jgi:hypothetical protein
LDLRHTQTFSDEPLATPRNNAPIQQQTITPVDTVSTKPLTQQTLLPPSEEEEHFILGMMKVPLCKFLFTVFANNIEVSGGTWAQGGPDDNASALNKARNVCAFCLGVAARQLPDGHTTNHRHFLTSWKQLHVNDPNYKTNLDSLTEITKKIKALVYLELKDLCLTSGAKWTRNVKTPGDLTVTNTYSMLEKVKKKTGGGMTVKGVVTETHRKYTTAR